MLVVKLRRGFILDLESRTKGRAQANLIFFGRELPDSGIDRAAILRVNDAKYQRLR